MIEISRYPNRSGSYRLACSVWLPAPLEDVFTFFSDASRLEQLTPPWLRFSVQTPSPIEMGPGTIIDYKLRVHGIPLRWRSQITGWEPPHRFTDVQLRGPYRQWHHTHMFETEGIGTRCRDLVEYRVPGGSIMHTLFVKRDLRAIFTYRVQVLAGIFGHADQVSHAPQHPQVKTQRPQ